MDNTTLFTLTAMVLCYAVISALVKRWYVAPALIFMLCGMALGPFGIGAIEVGHDVGDYLIVAELALTLILFNQAAALDLSAVVRRHGITVRLLVVGIPVSLGLGTLTALLLIPYMSVAGAIAVGAIAAPAEVALISALLEDRRIPETVRHALSTESGLYDGFALTTLVLALAVYEAHERAPHQRFDDVAWFLVRTEVMSVVAGLILGAIGGVVITWSRRRGWMGDTWAQLSMLVGALLCFQVGQLSDGSGLVAAFAGGLAFAFVAERRGGGPDTHVSDAAAHLLELVVFAMFGAYAVVGAWREVEWRVVAFVIVAVFAVRLIAVSLALIRTDLPPRDRLFIGWFGPRGLGTIVLGLLMIEHIELREPDLEPWITQLVGVAVSLSLVVHSLTVWPGINWLATKVRAAGASDVDVAKADGEAEA
ncbi:cation:proton antiporter [Mycobacterium sp. NPDC051804]|uniref:cation:proton antiporter domain-containing protein n=1 Tax=Mycobacterium sp. NPDC051804 TaxID=3364295 RepID=UPI0037BBA276